MVALPQRRHPSHNSVLTHFDNRSIVLFVTVVAAKRQPIFATPEMHEIIVGAWRTAASWSVGKYIIMPDHVHFFCTPCIFEDTGFHAWMKYWKSLATKAYWHNAGAQRKGGPRSRAAADLCVRRTSLFQRDCWDRQLRNGESYSDKWRYVQNNPVRKGLVERSTDWPFQGELNILSWHEKI